MTVFAILSNLSTILGLVHTIEAVVGKVATTKQAPALADLYPILDQVETIFKSGAVQIPGVDDTQIANALQMIRDQLSKTAA